MLEELTQHISQLKNLVSLRYIDPPMRQQCMQAISTHLREHQGLGICEEYIMKIEQSHEKMMGELSQFLDRLTPAINDYHIHLDNLQQQIVCNNKMHQLELEQQQNHQRYLNEKIQTMTQQLQAKEQDIRELTARLDEREAEMEVQQREERDYLNKIETDFEKQQKALEQAVFLIARRDEELRKLQGELSVLKEPRIKEEVYSDMVNVSHDEEEEQHSIQMASHRKQSDNSYSLVQCSFVTSPSRSEGLQQFQELKVQHKLEQVLVSQQMQGLQAPKTLRQMLNLSLQKQYKLLYNKCDSVEGNAKQNYQRNWGKQSKSKSDEKKLQWGINQSLQLLDGNKIKEFNLPPAVVVSKQNNPYYHYFVIASQNVKIRSKHFESFCNVSTEQEWKHLCQKRVPLHEWQAEIEQYLMRECNISS